MSRPQNQIPFTRGHIQVAGEVLSRAPVTVAEQMVLQELFDSLNAMLEIIEEEEELSDEGSTENAE